MDRMMSSGWSGRPAPFKEGFRFQKYRYSVLPEQAAASGGDQTLEDGAERANIPKANNRSASAQSELTNTNNMNQLDHATLSNDLIVTGMLHNNARSSINGITLDTATVTESVSDPSSSTCDAGSVPYNRSPGQNHLAALSITSTAIMASSEGIEVGGHSRSDGRHRREPFHCHVRRPGMNKLARNQLLAVSILCLLFMIGEIIGGTIANSLALITDATHLASDLMGFLVSLFAIWVAGRAPSARMSFGYYRAEVVGALISVLIIWITTAILVYLAVQRVIKQTFHIDADSMLITAGAGVAFNIIMGIVLNTSKCGCSAVAHAHGGHGHSHGGHGHSNGGQSHSHGRHGHSHGGHRHSHLGQSHSYENHSHTHSHSQNDSHSQENGELNIQKDQIENNNTTSSVTNVDMNETYFDEETLPLEEDHVASKKEININIRAAFIHILGDLIQSIGVFIAALIIKFKPEYKLADPVCTFVFSLLVLITTITILRDTLMVLLEAVPRGLNYSMCKFDLETLEGVKSVHSLNVWALTMGKHVVTVHLAAGEGVDRRKLMEESVVLLRSKYQAIHTTIQIEDYDHDVMTSCEDCVGPKIC